MSRPTAQDILGAIQKYLIIDLNNEAAESLADEAFLPKAMLETVRMRERVRASIETGDVKQAIEVIEKINPNLLKDESSVLFDLMLMQLVELIRDSDFDADETSINPALDFVKTQLLPMIDPDSDENNKAAYSDRMARVQKVMALICLDTKKGLPPDLANLLDQKERDRLARSVDAKLLKQEDLSDISGLEMYVRLTDLIRTQLDSDVKSQKFENLGLIDL